MSTTARSTVLFIGHSGQAREWARANRVHMSRVIAAVDARHVRGHGPVHVVVPEGREAPSGDMARALNQLERLGLVLEGAPEPEPDDVCVYAGTRIHDHDVGLERREIQVAPRCDLAALRKTLDEIDYGPAPVPTRSERFLAWLRS